MRAIQVLPNGDIVVGGDFMTFNGVPRNGVPKITSQADADAKLFAQPRADGTTRVFSKSQLGKTYTLQSKNFLSDAEWQNLSSAAGTGSTISFADSIGLGQQRYYRLKIE